ncbi:hypothetical protein P8S55_05035 [Halomonas sp. M1]|uniref:hypothetical protein n=1 Tax=Halomonas sp. M1 TaxID=3035470 RepID=UPI00248552F9|nr:hypothetical protein [Halomonas sp. M1]WFE72462.1 hypothetical protein P8S55_05035 [Halomonas sp. M1]
MPAFPLERLINLGLRASTLLAKFSLLFFLAFFLEPAEVALYGLLVATIGYSLYGLGFDFYSYSTRELIGSSQKQWARLLRDQGVFFVGIYLAVLPLLFLIFYFELLPWSVAPWFFAILVLEHLAQELNRLLVAMSRQLLASIVLFLRSGLWAFIVAIFFWLLPETQSLDFVFIAWCLGALVACLLGSTALLALDRRCLSKSINWNWISRGIKVAFPLLVATLALRGMFTIDRYWVQNLSGTDVLAAYVLYAGVANTVMSFLDAAVFVFLYPKIIRAYKEQDLKSYNDGMKNLLRQTLLVTFILCVLAALLIHPMLFLLQKEIYTLNVNILYVLLIAIIFFAMSMVPHYGLYAMSVDRHIIISHIIAFISFFMFAALFSILLPIYGIPLALCCAFAIMLVYKSMAYSRFKRIAIDRWSK